jgi:hypothetical protein
MERESRLKILDEGQGRRDLGLFIFRWSLSFH